jgi:hypothetical protein
METHFALLAILRLVPGDRQNDWSWSVVSLNVFLNDTRPD